MMTHRHLRRWPGRAAALVALLSLLLRLSAGMAVAAPAEPTLDVLLGVSICHAGGDADSPGDLPAGQAHDCALCPACFLPLPGLPVAPDFVPVAIVLLPVSYALPRAGAGPPARLVAFTQPRAPPLPA